MLDNYDNDAILEAAIKSVEKKGHKPAAEVMKRLKSNPALGETIQTQLKTQDDQGQVSPSRALAFLLDRDLSRRDYEETAKLVNEGRSKILPSYDPQILREKQNCRPAGLENEDEDTKIPMASVLHHSVDRIMEIDGVAPQAERLAEENDGDLDVKFYFKYGVDGSKGHPTFKQTMSEERVQGACMASHLVPLQMVCDVEDKTNILYENTLCNSPSSVRPLRLWFVPETSESAAEELDRLSNEVKELRPYAWARNIIFTFIAICSMCDGKMVNVILDNNAQVRCPFCRALPRDVLNPNSIFDVDPFAIALLCLSVLHFRLRIFEHLCKVAFRLDFKEYQVRKNTPNHRMFEKRKAFIIKEFARETGLTIFGVTKDGSTNDGNTSRR